MAHVFFASYANLDNSDKRLQKVVFDLRERVRGALGTADASLVGFFAPYDGIKTGADWEKALGDALREARVLVCFSSNTYFNSEYCANEFEIFRRRLAAIGGQADSLRVVISVVWQVAAVPKSVSRYQASDEASGFPTDYRQQGLLALRRSKNSSAQARYEQTMQALTTVIRDAVAGKPLPPLQGKVVFDELPGIFDNPGAYNIRVGAFHGNGLRWALVPELATTVRSVVETVASGQHLSWRALKVDNQLVQNVAAADAAREAVVLVADNATLDAGEWRLRLDALDAAAPSNCRVLVGFSSSAGAALRADDIANRLAELMPQMNSKGQVGWFEIGTPDVFATRLCESMVRLKMALVNSDEAEKVVDSGGFENAAKDQGIILSVTPTVAGPGGAQP